MTTRDTHHHGNLKAELIDWAMEQARLERLEQASLREAARVLGVSPGAVYRHFDSRDALLRTLTERGFEALAEAFDQAMPLGSLPETPAHALARFEALGAAYLGFARANYGLWRLMFGPAAMRVGAPDDRPNTFFWLRQALVDLAEHGVIATAGPEAELFAWSTIHGLSELAVSPVVDLPLPPDAAARLCRMIVQGLASET